MTIELVTGSPGAGKTCFVVSQRITAEIGRKVTAEDQFQNPIQVERRVVVAGVRGLKLLHERIPHLLTGEKLSQADIDEWNRIDDRGEPVHLRLPGQEPVDVEASLFNWWLWAKPGDLIVVDEVQFIVPRGTLGKKPPYWIQALEIHRHYGVDFLFITQHPDLLDPTIRKLVGLHRHVRAVMASALCTIYIWDHASNPERFSLANKKIWVRRAHHFALYKSSVAHVKPPSSGRAILVILPIMFAIVVYGIVHFKNRFSPPAPVVAGQAQAAQLVAGPMQAPALQSKSAAVTQSPGWQDVPKLTGCYAHAGACSCIDQRGAKVRVAQGMCELSAAGFDGLVAWEPRRDAPPSPAYGASASAGAGLPAPPDRKPPS